MDDLVRPRYRMLVSDSARWGGFQPREGDIVISTPPKCGTTWMQMITALLIFQDTTFPKRLSELSPWLDMLTAPIDEVLRDLAACEHRRFIKTHTPLDGLPWDDRITYVCVGRDPRDVALSWDNHMANFSFATFLEVRASAVGLDDITDAPPPPPPSDDPRQRFWAWAENDDPLRGLSYTLHHLRTCWERRDEPNVALFHYGDLQTDLPGQMRRLATVLGIELDDETLHRLSAAASFEAMKARAADLAPNAQKGIWVDNARFFNRGGRGVWRDLLGSDDLTRYDARVASIADDAEFVAWVHGGWLAP